MNGYYTVSGCTNMCVCVLGEAGGGLHRGCKRSFVKAELIT